MKDDQDNLEAAMEPASKGDLSRKPSTGSVPGEPAGAQVNVRTTEAERDKWKEAATAHGMSLSEYARTLLNRGASETLECQHEDVQEYPWSTICKKCGKRLR